MADECWRFVDFAYKYFRDEPPSLDKEPGFVVIGEIVGPEDGADVEWGVVCFSSKRNTVVLAFRGTEDETEWYEDIEMSDQIPVSFCDAPCAVHHGFFAISSGLFWREPQSGQKTPLMAGRLPGIPQDAKWIIAGHSLGAAVATLVALYVIEQKWSAQPPELYTLASPRVGDDRFVVLVTTHLFHGFRIVNRWDIVPHIPPADYHDPFDETFFRYAHCGAEVLVDGGFSLDVAYNHSMTAYHVGLRALTRASR